MSLMASCLDNVHPEDIDDDPAGQMVLFSAGNAENITRASIPFMQEGGRFVCRMYYRSESNAKEEDQYDVLDPSFGGTRITAWLKVNNKVGNSIYWNPEYTDVAADMQNEYGEKQAQAFYWQNRLTHAFLAIADYNTLASGKESTGLTMAHDVVKTLETNGSIKVYTTVKYELNDGTFVDDYNSIVITDGSHVWGESDDEHNGGEFQDVDGYFYQWTSWLRKYVGIDSNGEYMYALYRRLERVTAIKEVLNFYAREYDLTRGTLTSMSQQPDPIQARTLRKPDGATQEANRVNLYFRHQFSQVQVNIRTSSDENDIPVEPENIESVELLGVSKKGYVYVELNPDGSVRPSDFEPVNKSTCPEIDWNQNPHGTAFNMFQRTLSSSETALGYVKSYEAISFGVLDAIRIHWKESSTGVMHNVTYKIPDSELKTLQSGVKYIYNMEIRRGTLALVNTVIKNWEVDQTAYNTDGTIVENTTN